MAATGVIRCPVCLMSQVFPRDTAMEKTVHCGNCSRSFPYGTALPSIKATTTIAGHSEPELTVASEMPAQSIASAPASATVESTITMVEVKGNPVVIWVVGLILFLPVLYFVREQVREMKGPEFLLLYGILFIVLWIVAIKIRLALNGNPHITWITLLMYESIGVFRYVDASAAGMSRFSLMFILMGIGGVLLFIHLDGKSAGLGSSDCSSLSDCSSCSSCSGCGGGGGCGGCG